MSKGQQSATCAYCTRPLYEGQSAVYDELFDLYFRYFCDKACHSEWLAEHIEEYQRKYVVSVDL